MKKILCIASWFIVFYLKGQQVPNNITNPGPYPFAAGTYQFNAVDVTLQTGYTISSGAKVTVKAKNEIVAKDGFEVINLHSNGEANLMITQDIHDGGDLVGDVFIVAGQSNAVAELDQPDAGVVDQLFPSNTACRTIGYPYTYTSPPSLANDAVITVPTSEKNSTSKSRIGAWALKLQYQLYQQTNIPSAFVNGAVGGTAISFHLPSNTPSNPNSLNPNTFYDRIFSKMYLNGLTNKVKAIFWYQGEEDGKASSSAQACDYINQFDKLYKGWKTDYPNLKKIFLIQINMGCVTSFASIIREAQRKIAEKYQDVVIISTLSTDNNDRKWDGCHYTSQGYLKIADNLLNPVLKYVYNFNNLPDASILPPKIERAYYTTPDQICLRFDKDVIVQQATFYANTNTNEFIKDYFFGEGWTNINIQSITSTNNLVHLDLVPGGFRPKKITYLPEEKTNSNATYTGPWLLNKNNTNLGIVSFFEYPITALGTNDWAKVYTNFGNGSLGDFKIGTGDLFYPGDFDGDGTDEILCTQNTGGSSDIMTILKYTNGQWNTYWSNYGNQNVGNGIYSYRDNLIVGDFDGDGIDDLFGNGNAYTINGALFRFYSNNWNMDWSDNGNNLHGMWPYKNKMYAGDFDGDGKTELFGCDLTPGGWSGMFNWTGTDFTVSWSASPAHPITLFRSNLIAGDFDGNGIDDLLGMAASSSELFVYSSNPNNWNQVWANPSQNNFNGWAYPLAATDKILSGNIDNDGRDELMMLQTGYNAGWSISMNYSGSNWNWGWFANPIQNAPVIDDWTLADNGGTDTKYFFVRLTSGGPKSLLAIRHQGCGYWANFYSASNLNLNYRTPKDPENVPISDVSDDSDSNYVKILPNPNNGTVVIDIKNYHELKIQSAKVFNSQGQLVLEQQLNNNTSSKPELKLDELPNGVYYLELEASKITHRKKIILAK